MPAKCPCCGYEPTPTNRQILNRYKKTYGDLPVLPMIARGWLGAVDPADFTGVHEALFRFFEVSDDEGLTRALSAPLTGNVCNTEGTRPPEPMANVTRLGNA